MLYIKDSSLTEFDATVVEVNNDPSGNGIFIVLDQTAFYPTGGGQPHDTGILTTKEGTTYNLLFVGNFDGKISHQVDKVGLKEGDTVHGKIDLNRRNKLQRMHTACHVISSVFMKETGALITGNQIDVEKSRIDFSLEAYDPEKIKEYIENANQLLATQQDVEVFFLPRAEAENMPELAKLAKGLKEGIDEIRVVKIGNIDMQADGGTHVKNTKDVGKIILLKCENKGKSNRRLYFTLEP